MRLRYMAWGGVLLVLGHLCWLQLQAGSAAHAIWDVAAKRVPNRPATPGAVTNETDGNVLLQLVGYARTNQAVEESLFYYYCRTTYVLYPRRLYAAPGPDRLIGTGRDIMLDAFNPDPQWLKAHNVRYELAFGNGNNNGEPRFSRLPENDRSIGTQPIPAGGDR